jgi:hypothetical protein
MSAPRSSRPASKKTKIDPPAESKNENNDKNDATKVMKLRGRSSRFPHKLFEMVENAESQGYDHIVSWTIDDKGKHPGFAVHDTNLLSEQVLGEYFLSSNFRTFQRQLSYWSFERLSGIYSKKKPKMAYRHSSGLFRKGDKTLVDSITRRENKNNSTRKQGISTNLTHFATEADYALQSLEMLAESISTLDYEYMLQQGVCVTNKRSKDNQAASSSMKDGAGQRHDDLLLVDDHSNNIIPQQQEPEEAEEHARLADIVSLLDEIKCTVAERFDQGEHAENGCVNNSKNYYVGTNENTNNSNYYGARTGRSSCLPRAASTAPATLSSMPFLSDDDDEQSSPSRHHVQQPAADFEENHPAAIYQSAEVCWPQQLGQPGISFQEGRTFLSSLQKQVEDFMRKSAPSAHQQQPTTTAATTRQPTEGKPCCKEQEEEGSPAAAMTMSLYQTLNCVYCSLQQAEEECAIRYIEATSGNVRIEREALLAPGAAPPRLQLHHPQGPCHCPPPHQEPTTIHFPASINDYHQQHPNENFRNSPSAIYGEQELEPLSAEENNDDYSTTTAQAAVPAAVLLYMLNSANVHSKSGGSLA